MKKGWKYVDFADLVGYHIEVTRLSYNTHSKEYAESWEWNEKIRKRTKDDYLEPFVMWLKGKSVLVIGCGTGRDAKLLTHKGFLCLGIDSAQGMLREAVDSRGVSCPLLCANFESMDFMDESFDGVLIDSALEHIKKADLQEALEKVKRCLKKRGVCLIRFRIGTGKVFLVEDAVGERYFTSFTKGETKKIVEKTGMRIVDEFVRNHLEPSRPGFYTYILRK
ncbi:MAG: class I SAM-dependent methyltransferase [Patescibacteria group bacterium]